MHTYVDRGVGRGVAALSVALAATLLASNAAVAQDEPATETPPEEAQAEAPFRDGPWIGTMSASGTAEATVEGVDSVLHTHHHGSVSFDVSGGQVSGEGTMLGASLMTFTGPLEAIITMEHETAGTLTGDESSLVFDGDHDTIGTAVVASPAAASQQVGPNTAAFGPYDIEVVDFDCNRLFGDWSAGIQQAALDGGWQTTDIDGLFQADHLIQDLSENLREQGEQLLEDFNAWVDDVHANVHADAEEADTVFDAALRAEMMDLFNRAVDLEFELRNAPADERCAFGPDEGGFSYLFTAMVQELALFILSGHAGLDGETIAVLAENLSWMGGLGPGAIRAEVAQQIESSMEQRGSDLLEDHLVTDGDQQNRSGDPCSDAAPCLDPTEEALYLLETGAKHGLTYSPMGIDIPPEQASDMVAAA